MDGEKPPTCHLRSGIGDEPDERRHHHFGLDHLGAIEPRCVGHHGSVRDPSGDKNVDGDASAIEVLRHDRTERLERTGPGILEAEMARPGRDLISKAEPSAAEQQRRLQLSRWGAKGGREGGYARAAGMTPAERRESARQAALARWAKSKR